MKTIRKWMAAGVVMMLGCGLALAGGRKSLESAAPLAVVDAETLNQGGLTLDATLQALPRAGVAGADGGATNPALNLGGLPSSRTLTLLDGRRLVVGGGVGYNGDPTRNGSDSSEFLDLQVTGGATLQNGAFNLSAVLGGSVTQYGDRVENDGDDRTTVDFNFGLATSRSFSDSVILESFGRFHYGDHGTLGTGYVRPGLQETQVLDWETRTSLSYRFDGLGLGSTGWGFSTYYQSQGFLEEDSDERDVLTLKVGQEVRYNINDTTTVYGTVEYGQRRWDRWDIYDTEFINGGGGIRTEGDDYALDAWFGMQCYDYDDLGEDQHGLAVELNYTRYFSDRLSLRTKAFYGVQHLFPNEGFTDYVDATGLLLGSRLQYVINDGATVGLGLTVLDLDPEFGGEDLHRGQVVLDGSFALTETLVLNPSILWINNEDTPSGEDDSTVVRLGLQASF